MSALRSRPVLAAAIAYLFLAIALTWPLAVRIGTRVPQGDHDLWQNYWNAWWWDREFRLGVTPFSTDLLFYPKGTSLGWHTHSPANVITMLPVARLADALGLDGPAAALGVVTLAGFYLASLGGFLLAREVVGRAGPAFIAGIVFGYFPQHVEQSLEHLNLESYWAMPFALLYLARTARGDGAQAWIPAGIFLGLNALMSWHNEILLFLLAAAVTGACFLRSERKGKALIGLLLAGILAAIMALPFVWPMIEEASRGEGGFKKSVYKPIDPLFLLVPHSGHPFWGPLVAGLYERFRAYPSMGFTAYLGIGALGLAAVARGWKSHRAIEGSQAIESPQTIDRTAPELAPPPGPDPGAPSLAGHRAFAFWSILLAVHLVFAMGHHPLIAKQTFPSIRLPFSLLDLMPVFKGIRVANRFLVPSVLALSVLSAMGAAVAAGAFRRPGLRRGVLLSLGALLILDYLWVPYPLREVPRPPYLEALARQSAGLAVLDIPTGNGPRAALDMLQQTRHERPIASGYISREPPGIQKTLEDHPVLWPIFYTHPKPVPPGSTESLAEAVRALRIGLVVVHLDREQGRLIARRDEVQRADPADLYAPRLFDPEKGIFSGDLERCRRDLTAAFGPPVYQDPDTEIYRVK